MKKIVTFSEEQVFQIKGLLNGITVSGVQNCKQIAVISQVLEAGVTGEVKEEVSNKKEGEG